MHIGDESTAHNPARTTSTKSIFCEPERIVSCFCFDSINSAEQYLHFTTESTNNSTRTYFQNFRLLPEGSFQSLEFDVVEFVLHNAAKQTYHFL